MTKKPVVATNKRLLSEWDFEKNEKIELNPYKITLGSGKKAFWICNKCGNKWQMTIASRLWGQDCNSKKCILENKTNKFKKIWI